jgi:hypothetical protein
MLRFPKALFGLLMLVALPAQGDRLSAVTPRLNFALPTELFRSLKGIQLTAIGPVLVLHDGESMLALDYESGRELWQRTYIAPDYKNLSSPEGTLEQRTVLGLSGMIPAVGSIAILDIYGTRMHEDKSLPNRIASKEFHLREAVQAETGRVLWRQDTPVNHSIYNPGICYESLDIRPGLLLQAWRSVLQRGITLKWLDAATGSPLDPDNTPTDRDRLLRAPQKLKAPFLLGVYNSVYSLDPTALTMTPVIDRGQQYAWPTCFPNRGRILWYCQGDDDFAGHSVRPNYLNGTDLHGSKLWSFPRKVIFPDVDNVPLSGLPEPFSVEKMAACVARGTVLCSTRAYWYCLDVRDGHVIWKRPRPANWTADIVEVGTGFLVITRPVTPGNIWHVAHVEGRPGAFHRLAVPGDAVQIQRIGDELMVIDADSHLRAYPLGAFLSPRQVTCGRACQGIRIQNAAASGLAARGGGG